ncbi:MAG: YiiX/YebB-like N1pC/P60 family cysteine hydrolase [Leptospirillia bacterium]
MLTWAGERLARYLTEPVRTGGTGRPTPRERLVACLRPGDVLLVEGGTRISVAIGYLTQSTWSHAALFVGDHLATAGNDSDQVFVEADPREGVRGVGIDPFVGLHTRICRPVGLSAEEIRQVTGFAIARIGHHYDLRNVFDLARFLFPTPPVPARFRRRLLAFGSGDPTRAICSTLVAQAFQSIRYPILPTVQLENADGVNHQKPMREVWLRRHHTLFTPRDFDVSPYFEVIKPSLVGGFDHHTINWAED